MKKQKEPILKKGATKTVNCQLSTVNLLLIAFALLAAQATFAAAQHTLATDTIPGTWRTDSIGIFFFRPGSDRFMAATAGNEKQLAAAAYRADSLMHADGRENVMIIVDGYVSGTQANRHALRLARRRSNRVKSEFILRNGLKEENFSTLNRAEPYRPKWGGELKDVTVVSLHSLLREPNIVAVVREGAEPVYLVEPERAVELPATEAPTAQPVLPEEPEVQPVTLPATPPDYSLRAGLRVNALTWALLSPGAGIDLYWGGRWSAGAAGSIALFHHFNNYRYPRISTADVTMRRYFRRSQNYGGWYLLANAGVRWYDWRRGDTGRNGHDFLAGIGAGYTLPLSSNGHWAMDIAVGAGYLYRDYRKYAEWQNTGSDYILNTRKGSAFGVTKGEISFQYKF